MMVMYGSTIFIIMLTAGRVADPRLWYAPWLFEGEHARCRVWRRRAR